jgi:hypothetical protein
LEQSTGTFASISEVAAITGLTQDTLRWYEREGMIPAIARGSDRRRRYSERDVPPSTARWNRKARSPHFITRWISESVSSTPPTYTAPATTSD